MTYKIPEIDIPEKLLPAYTAKQKIIVLLGGRSACKTEFMGRLILMRVQTEGIDALCGREFQNSIDDSVHKLLSGLIDTIPIEGFDVKKKEIDCLTGGEIRYRGFSRNPKAVKSAIGFKILWIEEAQDLSQESIIVLMPTIRAAGSQFYFTANPQSSADPFSERFINPFLSEIQKNGYYEDDMHLIIETNWRDNPWHGELEPQRLWDYEHLDRAMYNHIWEGAFNDSVENALITAEWFDACVDAHVKLGFKPLGVRFAAHDPSDEGPDSKGYAFRHGSVLLDVQEMKTGNINEGGDWATGLAINHSADAFTWDCDGMGVGLNRQVAAAFDGHATRTAMFKGSEKVKFPDQIYSPAEMMLDQKTNKEAFKNFRAQVYFMLRDRVIRTYEAVVGGVYHDPDQLISFDSNIKELRNLKTELCRIPIKPNMNGMFELYTKEVMKTKFKVKSPNLADPVAMLMIVPPEPMTAVRTPKPMRPMGVISPRQGRSGGRGVRL